MKTLFTLLALFAAATFALADDHVDQGHVALKHKLTLEGAREIGEAAAKFAKDNGASPSIAVVDDGGYLLYFVRPEESFALARIFPSEKPARPQSSRSQRRILKTQSTKVALR